MWKGLSLEGHKSYDRTLYRGADFGEATTHEYNCIILYIAYHQLKTNRKTFSYTSWLQFDVHPSETEIA